MPGGRNGLPAAGPVPVPGAGPGACCGGSRMPPWVVVTTGAVLSAANCSVLVRLRSCCVCCAASCSASASENGGSSVDGESDGVITSASATARASTSARDSARSGRVCANGAVVAPTKLPATLPVPTVTLPLACELVITPPTELTATSPPAMLVSPVCTLPRAVDDRMVPGIVAH